MPHTRLVVPAILAAALATLTACSSSSKDSKSDSPSTGAGASTTKSSPASTSASTSAAATTPLSAIVLQAAEVPTGFKQGTPDANDDDAAQHAAIVACVGGKDTTSNKLDTARSSFDQGDNSITSEASRFKSDDDVATDVALLKNAKFDSCAEQSARQSLTKSLPAGSKIDTVKMETEPTPAGAPSNLAAVGHGTVSITANGQTVKIYTVVGYITGPRIEAEVDLTGVGAPPGDAAIMQTITAVAQRAAKG